MLLRLRDRTLDLSTPAVMGVLNVTSDSFSDGGRFIAPGAAMRRALEMVEEGAAIVDAGGESSRPGAESVSEAIETDRVVPVIERLVRELDCVISVDTRKPAVMRAALAAGAHMVNDVCALRAEGALETVCDAGAAVCLMHMQGEPATMQRAPRYDDVVAEVRTFLAQRVAACEDAGIARDRIVVDPGFGFGKTLAHNLALAANFSAFCELGVPALAGVSRKAMLGQLLGLPVEQRVSAGVTAAALLVWQGAAIVRTHDVKPTVEAVKLVSALRAYTIRP